MGKSNLPHTRLLCLRKARTVDHLAMSECIRPGLCGCFNLRDWGLAVGLINNPSLQFPRFENGGDLAGHHVPRRLSQHPPRQQTSNTTKGQSIDPGRAVLSASSADDMIRGTTLLPVVLEP